MGKIEENGLSELVKELKLLNVNFTKHFETIQAIVQVINNSVEAKPKASTPITTKTDDNKILKVKEITELEKSYMVKNEQGQIAFIGKTTIESIDLSNNTLTLKDNFKWILANKKDGTPNIQWREDNQ